jgi:hypothetical protein
MNQVKRPPAWAAPLRAAGITRRAEHLTVLSTEETVMSYLVTWLRKRLTADGSRRPRSRTCRPAVEALDGRIVPATIPNLTNAHFALSVSGHTAQLVIQSENTTTGQFLGSFTDPGRAITSVAGTVGAEPTGSTTASLSFFGMDRSLFDSSGISFSGKLTGTGSDGRYYGNDQLSGSGTEYLLRWGQPAAVSVTGNDLSPITNLNNAWFHIYATNWAVPDEELDIVSEQSDGTFTGTLYDGYYGQNIVVHGRVGPATDMVAGQLLSPLTFSGQLAAGTIVHNIGFSGMIQGTGTNGGHYGNDYLWGTEWDAVGIRAVATSVYGDDGPNA